MNDLNKVPSFGAADLTNCDREPIHIPGSIQPHGVLLALDAQTLRVVQVGGDTERLLGATPQDLLGNTLEARVGPAALDHLEVMLAETPSAPRAMFAFETVVQHQGVTLDAIIHVNDGVIVVEFEPRTGNDTSNPLTLVQRMVARLKDANSLSASLQTIADEVHAVTGFDRVMVYQFQPDGSGEVVAETRAANVDSFLGLRYPASDIPAQARELYLKNWMRLIPDARYKPALITPAINPVTSVPLNLTFSVLRSVSPLHLEYLANMGVRASMSLSLVIDGKLWGLIACHHREPRHLPHTLRSACELFAQMASLQVTEKITRERQSRRLRAHEIHSRLVESMAREDGLATALIQQRPNLLDYIQGDSVVIWWGGRASTLADTPDEEQISGLVEWLNSNVSEGVFVTDCLSEHYPPAKQFEDVASGLVALSISRTPTDYVLWFRREVISTVTWAGSPDKPVEISSDGRHLSPRKSFAAWTETVRGRSLEWDTTAIEAAHAMRTSILEVVLRWLDQAGREREIARERQNFLMAELDHRVKNIIGIIQSLTKFSARAATNLEEFTVGFQNRLHSMGRAQSLLSDARWEGAALRTLIEDEVAPFASAQRVTISGADFLVRPKAALGLSLGLHELVTNAAKHGALSTPHGRIEVYWELHEADAKHWLRLTWVERGGPPVSPPTRVGFGRTVVERTLGFELDGKVEMKFEPEGLKCIVMMPVDQISKTTSPTLGLETIVSSLLPTTIEGKRILLVEDQAMVAMDLMGVLSSAGATVVGPFGRLGQAVLAAEKELIDAALLDIDLDGVKSWPVADALSRRGVPFAFTSGYRILRVAPARFAETPSLAKPYKDKDILSTVLKLLT